LEEKISSEGGSPPEEGRLVCRQAGSFGGKITIQN